MRKLLFTIITIALFLSHAIAYDFQIAGTSGWTKTPYAAIEGKELVIAAKGKIKHSFISGWHGPSGNSAAFCTGCRYTTKCNVAALIMKIGENGKIYCVDPIISGKAPASGPIYFAINDMPLNDNEGSFIIKLEGPGVTLGGSHF